MELTKQQKKEIDIDHTKAFLRSIIDEKEGILIVISSVARSGMSRRMKVYNHGHRNISSSVAEVLGWPENEKGILVTGCGMDMTFHLTYILSQTLYNEERRKELSGNGGGCLPWQVL